MSDNEDLNDELDGDQQSEERATSQLAATLNAIRIIEGKGLDADLARNSAISRNILKEELGDFGPYDGTHYDLSKSTRNILLAHVRQDAAHATINSIDTIRRLEAIEKRLRRLTLLVLAVLVLAIALFTLIVAVSAL